MQEEEIMTLSPLFLITDSDFVWAVSEVKGQRAAEGAERAGGGWRLRRVIIFGS